MSGPRLVLAAAPLVLLGCASSSPPGGPPARPPADAAASPAPTAAATPPFAEARDYLGPCATSGRGGCYRLTIDASGAATFMLLDAGLRGRVERVGQELHFVADGKARGETFTTTDDFATLTSPTGTFVRQPAK